MVAFKCSAKNADSRRLVINYPYTRNRQPLHIQYTTTTEVVVMLVISSSGAISMTSSVSRVSLVSRVGISSEVLRKFPHPP